MKQSRQMLAFVIILLLGMGGLTLLMMSSAPRPQDNLVTIQPDPVKIQPSTRPGTRPDAADNPFNMGRMLARQKKFPEAIEQYRLTMDADPTNDRACITLACLLANTGDTA